MVEFFFFKQKTAYEMRISDWSSDVCSSDLLRAPGSRADHRLAAQPRRPWSFWGLPGAAGRSRPHLPAAPGARAPHRLRREDQPRAGGQRPAQRRGLEGRAGERLAAAAEQPGGRSEEHTSELQSLMRISYAVFCLKTKQKHNARH